MNKRLITAEKNIEIIFHKVKEEARKLGEIALKVQKLETGKRDDEQEPVVDIENELRQGAIELFQAYIIAGHDKYISTYNDWVNTGSRLDKANDLLCAFEHWAKEPQRFWSSVSRWKDEYAAMVRNQGYVLTIGRLQHQLAELDQENKKLRDTMSLARQNAAILRDIRLSLGLRPDGDVYAAVMKLIKRKKKK